MGGGTCGSKQHPNFSAAVHPALPPRLFPACHSPTHPSTPTPHQAASSGKVPRGREVHGTSVIQRLVPFMTLPLEEMHAVKHAASATLLEFLVSCRANCEQLGAMAHRCGRGRVGWGWRGMDAPARRASCC